MKGKITLYTYGFTLTIAIAAFVVNYLYKPYQNLLFPLDAITIGCLAAGLAASTTLVVTYILPRKPFLTVLPLLVMVMGYMAWSSKFFIGIYFVALLVVCIQALEMFYKAKITKLLLLFTGYTWLLVGIGMVLLFLYNRHHHIHYKNTPHTIWPYVAVLYLVALWVLLKLQPKKAIISAKNATLKKIQQWQLKKLYLLTIEKCTTLVPLAVRKYYGLPIFKYLESTGKLQLIKEE